MVAELILSITSTTVTVNTEKFHAILDQVGSLPFILYSINGCKRTGKSYTLNHFIRYLEWKTNGNCDVNANSTKGEKIETKNPFLEDGDENGKESIEMTTTTVKDENQKEDDKGVENEDTWFYTPLPQEFEWRRGSERVTVGIYMWDKPFIISLDEDDKNGSEKSKTKQVAVLLMDTQGLFDAETTPQQNAIIFSFSSFCSSVMIYNQMKFIDENILQNLHMFADFASVCTPQEMKDADAFQQLMFLIRDFDYVDEFGYGIHYKNSPIPNGPIRNYLHETLLLQGKTIAPESLEARQKIMSTFKEVSTFLMPDPGHQFRSNPNQVKPLSTFSQYLKSLVQVLASSAHLETKKVGGDEISGTEFKVYVDAWAREFKNIQSSFPTVKTIAESMADVNNSEVAKKWLNVYISRMDAYRMKNPMVQETELNKYHEESRDEVLEKFKKERKLGSERIHTKFLDELKNGIKLHFERVLATHKALRRKAKKIKKKGRRMTAATATAAGAGTGIITYYAVESTMGFLATSGTMLGSILGVGGLVVGLGLIGTALAVNTAVKSTKKSGFPLESTNEVNPDDESPSKSRRSILPMILKRL